MENAGFLFAAYSIVWAAVFFYHFVLFRRQARLQHEIDLLKQTLKEKPAGK